MYLLFISNISLFVLQTSSMEKAYLDENRHLKWNLFWKDEFAKRRTKLSLINSIINIKVTRRSLSNALEIIKDILKTWNFCKFERNKCILNIVRFWKSFQFSLFINNDSFLNDCYYTLNTCFTQLYHMKVTSLLNLKVWKSKNNKDFKIMHRSKSVPLFTPIFNN